MTPRKALLAVFAFCVFLLLLAFCAPNAHAASMRLGQREAAVQATLISQAYGSTYALHCTDRPGSSPRTRTCLMADGLRLRVTEQPTGYLIHPLNAPHLDIR